MPESLILGTPYPDSISSLYFGFLLAIGLFALAGSVRHRDDPSVPWFALAALLSALWLLVWQGRFPADVAMRDRAMPLLGALFMGCILRYGRLSLETRRSIPELDTALRAFGGMVIFIAGLSLLLPRWALGLLAPVSLAIVIGLAAAACIRLRRRHWMAAHALVGLLLLLAALLPNAWLWLGQSLPPTPAFWMNVYQLGSGLALTVFCLGAVASLQRRREDRMAEMKLALDSQRTALNKASIDEITRLPDRRRFRELLLKRIREAHDQKERLAIVSISLSSYRTLRHGIDGNAADAGLAEIALRLRQSIGSGELLTRADRDTFIWVTTIHPSGELLDLQGRCLGLRRDIGAPLANAGGVMVACDIGYAIYPDHGGDVDLLLRRSDEALYRTEQAGLGEVTVFQQHQQSHQHLRLAKELRQALIRNELVLHYQPLVGLEQGELRGCEALIRWPRDGVMVPPGEFIPVAEASGIIVQLGEWVMQQACRQIADWQSRGLDLPYVAVNVSAHQFRHPEFLRHVEMAVAAAPLSRNRLVLEITENIVLDDIESTSALLQQLLDRGVSAAVDDFGVGYSSLNYLRKLPVQAIKIDRSFLQGIPQEQEAMSVMSTIITLGHDLGLRVIAEGVETVEQQMFLSRKGVNCGQGWLFSKALAATDFEIWMIKNQKRLGMAQALVG
ncbi:phosphodiesterase [Solimonas sp. K1W22B-7]|uniref:putative bifunctional diguanylate cyclase/phosphodiesterase n=1 Tax=Solimonas sp. K1W22B-7 TaxID=2303331 RepID=UPI000E332B59|nr:GGDEF domain-containing phosphodiesterase [Solimonas sp. K1W22B-7]AXQ29333.1 phosphodiesterase [Solimonas sp. K1W22B-7]